MSKIKRTKKPETFRFRHLDAIGASAAEDDVEFLQSCFVDNGYLPYLHETTDPRSIILGRTGTGKTALLKKLCGDAERVIEIKPESLALSYISNSTILNFISDLGVNLDTFFRLLWRHVFTVEILRRHFSIGSNKSNRFFLQRLVDFIKHKRHREAVEYLRQWGETFWEETEYRIKEITQKLESEIEGSIGMKATELNVSINPSKRITEEQKKEIIQRAQTVVNRVQVRELSSVINLIDEEVLTDPQKKYYIVIDRLDEDWVEDRVRYRLIRSLIDTIRNFNSVRHAKIIIAIRIDLLQRVYRLTRAPGFQEEKLASLYLPLRWTKKQLIDILDTRIDHLIQRTYTNSQVSFRDILPQQIGKQFAIDYILDRTFMRPRDVILYFNQCIAKAEGQPKISPRIASIAEGEYSKERLRSLQDEWSADYPNMTTFTEILKGSKSQFLLSDLTKEDCENFCLDFLSTEIEREDDLSKTAKLLYDDSIKAEEFRKKIIAIFYNIGLLEVKLEKFEGFSSIISRQTSISSADLDDNMRIKIHAMFWRVLGIKPV